MSARNGIGAAEEADPAYAMVQYAALGREFKVRKLLKSGLDPNEIVTVSTSMETLGDSALYAAAGGGHVRVAKALIDAGATVDIIIDDGWTPLHHACLNGHVDMAAYLVDQGADMNRRETINGSSPLHIAAEQGYSRLVRLLIERGAVRDAQDDAGYTAADVACLRLSLPKPEKQTRHDRIRGIFYDVAQREIEAEKLATASRTILQQDLQVKKPLRLKTLSPKR